MATTATASGPAEAISVAVSEVYDRLREIVDRGPTDDPELLDELAALTRRARARVTRARKRAEPGPAPVSKPAAKPEKAVPTESPRRSVTLTIPRRRKEPKPAEPPRPVAAKEPASTVKPAPARARRAEPRPRRRSEPGIWLARLAIILLMVAGTALSVATGVPWWGWLGVALGATVHIGYNRWVRRPAGRRSRADR